MNYTWSRVGKLAAAVLLAILTGWFVCFWRWWHFGPSQRILGATRKWSELLHALGEEDDSKEARAAQAHKLAVEKMFPQARRRLLMPKRE